MHGLYAYDKCKDKYTCATYFHGGWTLPEFSNVNPFIYLCVTINFIDAWINTLDKNIESRCLAHQDKMKETFQKIQKKKKIQLLKTSGENIKTG